MEPVARFVRQLLSSSGRLLVADPSERTRHNRCGTFHACCCMPAALNMHVCMVELCMRSAPAVGPCREYFVDMLLSDEDAPMLLEECGTVLEPMDDKAHAVDIMHFRFRLGGETVGIKPQRT